MKNKQIFDIIERIKGIEKIHSDAKVAQVLDISKENLSNYKTKGRIPYKAISNYCLQKGVRVDYVQNGTLPIYEAKLGQSISEQAPIYNQILATQPTINTGDLITKVIAVLESSSLYSTALQSNILAFHHAVVSEKQLNKETNETEKNVNELKKVPPDIFSDTKEDGTGKKKAM
jgi:predicted type IV restriction endonuclease